MSEQTVTTIGVVFGGAMALFGIVALGWSAWEAMIACFVASIYVKVMLGGGHD